MFRLRRVQRIRHQNEFDIVFKQGRRFSKACFAFFYLETTHEFSRLGLVVSKRNCPLAVKRNRIKRIIRAQFRETQAQLKSGDLVVLLRSQSARMSDQEQTECIKKLFSQLVAVCDGRS